MSRLKAFLKIMNSLLRHSDSMIFRNNAVSHSPSSFDPPADYARTHTPFPAESSTRNIAADKMQVAHTTISAQRSVCRPPSNPSPCQQNSHNQNAEQRRGQKGGVWGGKTVLATLSAFPPHGILFFKKIQRQSFTISTICSIENRLLSRHRSYCVISSHLASVKYS